MEDKEVRQIAAMVMRLQEEREMQKLARDMRARERVICHLNKEISANYDKLLLVGHTIDIRYLCLLSVILEIKKSNIPGDFAEFGVYRGGFAKRIHALAPDRHLYLFDTFTGFDQGQRMHDVINYNIRPDEGNFLSNTSVDIVLRTIGDNGGGYIHPVPGFFPTSAEPYRDKKFAFVSIDADLYQSTRDGIEFFYPRLTPGGYIMAHDFSSTYFRGVRDAITEYAKKEHLTYIPIPDLGGTAIISKPIK